MENLRGALLMVFAMFSFAVEDAVIKALSVTMPVGQVLSITCAGALLVFFVWFIIRRIPIWQAEYLDSKVLMRSGCDVMGTCFFITALSIIPLTTASAVIQATPLVVAMGAAIFLGQSVGWRRWIAITIGFIGVLLIIRPGMEGFTPATLLAVAGMFGLAARDLFTRGLTVTLTGVQLATHTFALLVPAGLVLMFIQGHPLVIPNPQQGVLLFASVIIGIIAYLAIVAATRTGNAGIISSFRYSRMVFALIIGYIIFAETPDTATLAGAAIIIVSGIYTLWRETRLRHASLAAQPAL